eukprot:scaffold143_cov260-Pinguiococcus_pyrenoidosus.AAC.25
MPSLKKQSSSEILHKKHFSAIDQALLDASVHKRHFCASPSKPIPIRDPSEKRASPAETICLKQRRHFRPKRPSTPLRQRLNTVVRNARASKLACGGRFCGGAAVHRHHNASHGVPALFSSQRRLLGVGERRRCAE